MCAPALLLSITALVALGACAAGPPQRAANDQCRQFALSGGYPFLRGGPVHGPNANLEQLPGAPPLWLGGIGEPGVTAHLDEMDYLEAWCLRNSSRAGPEFLARRIAVAWQWNSVIAIS